MKKCIKGLFILTTSVGLLGIFAGCAWQGNNANMSQAKVAQESRAQDEEHVQETSRHQVESGEAKEAMDAMGAGHYKEAVDLADQVIQKHPNNSLAYSVKGLSSALLGDINMGHAMTDKAYELDPNNIANFYNTAMVYKLEGDIGHAKTWFEKVLAKEPSNTWSLYGIATIYADQGNDEEALVWLGKAIQTDSSVKEVARQQDHFARFHGNKTFETLTQ